MHLLCMSLLLPDAEQMPQRIRHDIYCSSRAEASQLIFHFAIDYIDITPLSPSILASI